MPPTAWPGCHPGAVKDSAPALAPESPILNPPFPATNAGFTLLEVLVVVVIVAVLATALVLAVGGGSERKLANEAERFQALLGHACEQAELGGREIGVVLGGDGYLFLRLDGAQWRAFARDDELRARAWPAGLGFELRRDGRRVDAAGGEHAVPQIVCFSSGELTPFALTLSLGDAARRRIDGGEDGSVRVQAIEALP
ncbi:MAG: type II secretion system minor pseudopilin GspH [Dokdonella sp.]|uniref:type II secretion system minor pseudopilin GspH n=1 Tax=Dokdonella sp. TaxID=2291710 RepID=UPI003F7D3C5C